MSAGHRGGSLAIVGCGYVVDFYLACLAEEPWLTVDGLHDARPERAAAVAARYGLPRYDSLDAALASPADIVVNLTSLESHEDVTRRALLAGKHVYSEKPAALGMPAARELVALAARVDRHVCTAPATVLSSCAAALEDVLRSGRIGEPKVAHLVLEDGAVHLMSHERWVSPSGAPWPAAHELEAGPVLEHAGYGLSWLIRLFGPVLTMSGASVRAVPAKERDVPAVAGARPPELTGTADWAQWTLDTAGGVPCSFTCGQLAPRTNHLRVVGSDGVVTVEDLLRCDSPLSVRRHRPKSLSGRMAYLSDPEPVAYTPDRPRYRDEHAIDFAAGIRELASCLGSGDRPRLHLESQLNQLQVMLEMARCGSRTVRLEA